MTMTTNQTLNLEDQMTQLVLQSLRATAQEVARVESITYAQALERVMSVMCGEPDVHPLLDEFFN